MCHGGGDSRGLVRHPADLVPWGLPPGGGLCGRPPAIGCGWRSALDVRVPFSVEGLLTTGSCPLACAGLATILTIRFVGRTGSSATGVRDFAIIGIASMAAVSVPAAPAMGLLIVDSMTVPVDQRYSEGMLGAFSLIARVCLIVGVCLVKGGGKTYHWVVDVRRKPTIEPPTWPTLPPPFTPAFTRRKNACKARSTRLRVATARLRCAPAHTGSS